MKQLSIDFNPSISRVYKTAVNHVRMCMERHCSNKNMTLDYLAADLGMSPNSLYKKLSANSKCKNKFTLDDLENYLTVSGDKEPVKYLVAKFLYKGNRSQIAAQIADLQAQLEQSE